MLNLRCAVFVLALSLAAGSWGAQVTPSARAKSRYAEAQEQWRAGNLELAAASFGEAACLAPGWPPPLASQAVVQQLRGRDEDARQGYTAVQRLSLEGDPGAEALGSEKRTLLAALEGLVCWLINRERQRSGTLLLLPDAKLASVARQHSAEMRDLDYFSHASPTTGLGTPADRFVLAFGSRPRCLAENLSRRWGAASRLSEEKLTDSHQSLMASAGHRANIMHPAFQCVGIGLAADATEAYWLTEMFVQWR